MLDCRADEPRDRTPPAGAPAGARPRDQARDEPRDLTANAIDAPPAAGSPSPQRPFTGPASAAVTALAGLFFLLLCYLPLRATDLWVHVTWGGWILDHRALPAEDPVMPLAAGMEVVDGEWLSQAGFALVERLAGPEGLTVLFALTLLAVYLALGRAFWLQTRGLLLAVAGAALALAIGFSRLTTIRPENFGVLAFALLLWLLVASGAWREPAEPLRSRRLWLGAPLLFAVWANLHGSFPAGLGVLGCLLVGRAVEVGWRRRSLAAVIDDRPLRRWLLLTELAFGATLLNPYGLDLHLHTLLFAANENLKDIIEWWSLNLSAWGGREFAFSWVLLLVVMRHGRRRMPVGHVLLLAAFSWAVVRANRFIGFYAPLFVWVLMPHLEELWRRRPRRETKRPRLAVPGLTPRVWLAFHLLLVWAVFALSPISRPLLGGVARPPERLLGDQTPIALAAHLRASPPEGLVYSPQVWADYLVWAGPPGLQPMVTSMIHLIPHRVWRDYLAVHNRIAGWPRVMDSYGIDRAIFSSGDHAGQIAQLRRASGWELEYEDELGAVFRRRPAAAARPATPDEDPVATPGDAP